MLKKLIKKLLVGQKKLPTDDRTDVKAMLAYSNRYVHYVSPKIDIVTEPYPQLLSYRGSAIGLIYAAKNLPPLKLPKHSAENERN